MTTILCLNANTTPAITRRVSDEMRLTLGSDVNVVDGTPEFGPAVIKTRLDLSVAEHAVVDAASKHTDVDAIMLAVSFDTGRDALREALSIPVIGMSEASVALARMSGRRIGYVSIGIDITPLYHEKLTHCYLDSDMAGWETVEAPQAYVPGEESKIDGILTDACQRLAAQQADVVVLLGAVLAGAARRIQTRTALPVIDGGTAGALAARMLVDLKLPASNSGSFALRSGGSLSGVATTLAALQK